MCSIKKKLDVYNDKGSVMLETILVLPMYLVFITVIFFAGEVSLYRNLLLQMDQHDLWAWGAKDPSEVNVAEDFFGSIGKRDFMGDFEITAKDKDETVVSSNGWWKKNALKNNAVLKVPGWIKSIRVLSGLMGQKSDEAFNYSNEFELRKNDKKLVLYSRNNNDDRTKNGEDLCKTVSNGQPAWVTIANENYAGSDEGQELSGKSVSAYTRQTSVYGVFTGE